MAFPPRRHRVLLTDPSSKEPSLILSVFSRPVENRRKTKTIRHKSYYNGAGLSRHSNGNPKAA